MSTKWASRYLATEAGNDTFNLYDTSALAHADLIHAMRAAGHVPGLAINDGQLLANLRAQLGIGVSRAAGDPFRSGVIYNDFDAAPFLCRDKILGNARMTLSNPLFGDNKPNVSNTVFPSVEESL